MSRMIDADALKRAFCNHCDGDEPCTEPCIEIGLIETAPTIDAVEVVRCKNCRWGHLCVFGQHLGLDGFCSKGERKEQTDE